MSDFITGMNLFVSFGGLTSGRQMSGPILGKISM